MSAGGLKMEIYSDYGNGYPLLILADVYVEGRYLTGRLYSNNIDRNRYFRNE